MLRQQKDGAWIAKTHLWLSVEQLGEHLPRFLREHVDRATRTNTCVWAELHVGRSFFVRIDGYEEKGEVVVEAVQRSVSDNGGENARFVLAAEEFPEFIGNYFFYNPSWEVIDIEYNPDGLIQEVLLARP
ncbi:MAG: hypothetical protein KDB82_14595 [Planctomycetes bacterium]|nr:hypothetical protein [Planctomycetota bacterium]